MRIAVSAVALLSLLVGCAGAETEVNGGTPAVAATASPTATVVATAAESASPTTEPTSTPPGETQLTVDWTLPFAITAPADWTRFEDSTTPTAVEIVDGTGLRVVLAAFLKSPDTPEEWVERLVEAEELQGSEPEPAEVGGASGHVFDVRLAEDAEGCAGGGSSLSGACWPIHGPEDGWLWVIEGGRAARVWVLDVDGETVVMMSDAREDRFDQWVATIEEAVSTLQWQP